MNKLNFDLMKLNFLRINYLSIVSIMFCFILFLTACDSRTETPLSELKDYAYENAIDPVENPNKLSDVADTIEDTTTSILRSDSAKKIDQANEDDQLSNLDQVDKLSSVTLQGVFPKYERWRDGIRTSVYYMAKDFDFCLTNCTVGTYFDGCYDNDCVGECIYNFEYMRNKLSFDSVVSGEEIEIEIIQGTGRMKKDKDFVAGIADGIINTEIEGSSKSKTRKYFDCTYGCSQEGCFPPECIKSCKDLLK